MNNKPFQTKIRRNINELDSVVVEVEGYLDAHTVVGFEEQMNELVEAGAKRIVVDMENLQYISSAGIGAMIGLAQRLRRSSGDLLLVRPNAKIHKILNLLGFTEVLKIVATEEEAIAALRNPSD